MVSLTTYAGELDFMRMPLEDLTIGRQGTLRVQVGKRSTSTKSLRRIAAWRRIKPVEK